MYLLAKEIPKSNLFTNWKGREGKFVRTFGMNSQRNKNEWRATWESIKKYIHTALEFPGIEYEVCKAEGCDLDHVEADTFEENVAKQKPFERTKIIDYVLDEKNESADLIHEVFDDSFWEKLQKREIKYVSPLIWPLTNGVKILGQGRAGLPIIDTNAWKFVHDAFLKNNPAFGDDIATVKTMCEGKHCDVKLLSAKTEPAMCGNCKFFVENNTCKLVKGEIREEDVCDLYEFGNTNPKNTTVNPTHEKSQVNYKHALAANFKADTTIANQENISHLQEIPLLYKHKGQLILLSASKCVQDIIKKKKDSGIKIDDQALAIAFSECGETKGKAAKSSFKTCSCTAKQNTMPELEQLQKDLDASEHKNKELEAKLKAQEDKKDEETSHAARKGRYAKLFANVDEEEREKMVASLRANEDDKDDLKAATEVDDEMKKAKKGNTDDSENEKLKARLTVLESEKKDSMVADLVALKAKHNLSQKDVNEYHASLKGKTHDEILSKFEDNKYEIKSMKASTVPKEDDFQFNGTEVSSLRGKTLTEIVEASF
jgi:hypothetical protein